MGRAIRILIFGGVVAAVILSAGVALLAAMAATVPDLVQFATEHDDNDERAIRP